MGDALEFGPQRRMVGGRPLHCCCICGNLGLWDDGWSWFGSVKDEDEGKPLAKFCTSKCAAKAGPNCENVTEAMKRAAKDAEMRPPKPYKAPPQRRSYADAAYEQRKQRERQERITRARLSPND
jgi:hypothetical protein